jgi:hypothetical protein
MTSRKLRSGLVPLPLSIVLALALSLAAPPLVAAPAGATAKQARPAAAAANLPVLHVEVTVDGRGITSATSGLRPGNTVFDLTMRGRGHAAVQLLRLRHGYTVQQLRRDLEKDSVRVIRRIDRRVVFYGGMPVSRNKPAHFGAEVDAGRYFLFDFDHPRQARLRVHGDPELRSLPDTTGSVDMVLRNGEHRFRTPQQLPRSGWLSQTNRTDEPHFMDLTKVKRSTTRKQVRRALAGKGPENPSWVLHDYPGTFVVSPGRTVVWQYDFPRGKYLELCFWPSDEDGTAHAFMGMWNFVTLD